MQQRNAQTAGIVIMSLPVKLNACSLTLCWKWYVNFTRSPLIRLLTRSSFRHEADVCGCCQINEKERLWEYLNMSPGLKWGKTEIMCRINTYPLIFSFHQFPTLSFSPGISVCWAVKIGPPIASAGRKWHTVWPQWVTSDLENWKDWSPWSVARIMYIIQHSK